MSFIKEDKELKCPRCRHTVISLDKEGLPKRYLKQYPEGLCRDCKRNIKKQLKALFS